MPTLADQIQRMAAKEFDTHVVTVAWEIQHVSAGYNCRRADGLFQHAFTVVVYQSYMVVTGDIGCLVLQRTKGMIDWAKGAINDINYFAEKVVAPIKTKAGVTGYNANFLWCYEAVKWFVKVGYPAMKAQVKE